MASVASGGVVRVVDQVRRFDFTCQLAQKRRLAAEFVGGEAAKEVQQKVESLALWRNWPDLSPGNVSTVVPVPVRPVLRPVDTTDK